MTKESKRILWFFAFFLALVLGAQLFLPRPVDWRRVYLSGSKAPYGCSALYGLLGRYAGEMQLSRVSFATLNEWGYENASILIVDDMISLSRDEFSELKYFVESGNSVFIAARAFYGALEDSLKFNVKSGALTIGNVSADGQGGSEIHTRLSALKGRVFRYADRVSFAHFAEFDPAYEALAGDGKSVCLIGARMGKGRIFLCTAPDLFANYFVVDHPNRTLTYAFLSLLKSPVLLWDEYYKSNKPEKQSPMQLVLGNDSLYYAWLLLLGGLLVYIIFEGRRKQRAIPVLPSNTNGTLEFVGVISNVYFNSGNHGYIAGEKIRYFYDWLRRKFGVETSAAPDELAPRLSAMSGVAEDEVRQLLRHLAMFRGDEADEESLHELSRRITDFKTKSKR